MLDWLENLLGGNTSGGGQKMPDGSPAPDYGPFGNTPPKAAPGPSLNYLQQGPRPPAPPAAPSFIGMQPIKDENAEVAATLTQQANSGGSKW